MLTLPASVRIFAAREAVDFRKGFDGLCGLVRDGFGDDPFSGQFFLFFNRRRDRVKLLVWDRNGFWLFTKRRERGDLRAHRDGRGQTRRDRPSPALDAARGDRRAAREVPPSLCARLSYQRA